MSNNEKNKKQCKYCSKLISVYKYHDHKLKCKNQLIVNPNQHMLMNHLDVIKNFLNKYKQLYSDFLKNKTVALVGPAESIIGTGKGDIIDKFDIVVRLNKSLPLPKDMKNDIGTKTSILYNSLNVSDFPGQNKFSNRFLKEHQIQFLSCPYPVEIELFRNDILNYIKRNNFGIPFKTMDLNSYKSLERSIQTRPFTGTCAIVDLLSYDLKLLYITGLDFYTTKYYKKYRMISDQQQLNTQNNIIHKSTPQLNLLKHISLFDQRVYIDNYLDQLLYKNYYYVLNKLNKINFNIFSFDNPQIKDFFKLDMCNITYTINNQYKIINHDKPTLVITNNKYLEKQDKTYLLFVTNNIENIIKLNKDLVEKKYIGNFYYKKNEKSSNHISIYLNPYFINYLKKILKNIQIYNCNLHFLMFLSLILYSKDNHFFNSYEIYNDWGLSTEEKKFFNFLIKKKAFNDIMKSSE